MMSPNTVFLYLRHWVFLPLLENRQRPAQKALLSYHQMPRLLAAHLCALLSLVRERCVVKGKARRAPQPLILGGSGSYIRQCSGLCLTLVSVLRIIPVGA